MSNKIGVLTVSFNESELIEANIKQFKKFNFLQVIVYSTRAWHGGEKWDQKYPVDKWDKNKLNFMVGDFTNDAGQRNEGLSYLWERGIDWTLVVDSDEFWTEDSINKLLKDIEKNKNSAKVITAPNMHVYWKTRNKRINPDPQPDNPVVAMRTDQRFRWSRLNDCPERVETQADFHHLSYVRDDEKMRQKMAGSEHAHELIPGWYENVWMTDRTTNLHPVIPEQFACLSYESVPKEIEELF